MVDIKNWLVAAAATLGSGEVVKPPTLSYLDAMNALEIMDPAMDVGASFSPRGAFDPQAPLRAAQVVWIMDEMAARELAWLRGSTMAQTVFTSLHYHNALDLGAPRGNTDSDEFPEAEAKAAAVALRAFVLAYAKAVDMVYAALLDANGPARDCEDVWLDPYGIPLETTESADEVGAYLDQIIFWLEGRIGRREIEGEVWCQVQGRLRFRKAWIDALQLRHTRYPPRSTFATMPPACAVSWAFDDVTPFLRQNMPYPGVAIPDHEEAWTALVRAIEHLQAADLVAQLPLARQEQFLRSRVDDMLPIVRCVYKTVLCDTPSVDYTLDEWLRTALNQPPDVLRRIDATVSQQERGKFALWRDIVGGTLLLTLSAPLANPARRRRSLLHLSETWATQTAAAKRISSLAPLLPALRARSVDCALTAHLLGFSLGLYTEHEMRSAWWVTLVLARARGRGGWEGEVARAWAGVGAAMVLLYTLTQPKCEPTNPQFVLRHKILLKSVGVSVTAWERARHALDAQVTNVPTTLATARAWLADAEARFASPALSAELDINAVVADIRANLAALDGMREARFRFGRGPSGIVPLLVTSD